MCKNIFAENNGIIVLIFHAKDLIKSFCRSMHGPVPDPVTE